MALHTWGGFAAGGQTPNECKVIISRDGTATAETSTQDLGTAQRTVTAIVTAEVLGLTPPDIVVKLGESQYGFSSGSGGSTTCPSQAPAALLAAQAARDDLFEYDVDGEASRSGDIVRVRLTYVDPVRSALGTRLEGSWSGQTLIVRPLVNPFQPDGTFLPNRPASSADPDDSFGQAELRKSDLPTFLAACARLAG